MIYKNKDYYNAIDIFAPFSSAEGWDNVGLLVGSLNTEVAATLVALDLTSDVLDEAKTFGANLIITHHPVIFPSLRRIDDESLLYRAIREDISVISAHTNYDRAQNGINDALAVVLGLNGVRVLESTELPSLGRIGELAEPMSSRELSAFVKERLNVNCVKYTSDSLITTVAVAGGSCAELWKSAFESGAQALVTAEVKHHLFLAANEAGFTLIDAGHFSTEIVAVSSLAEQLSQALPDAKIIASKILRDPVNYI